MSDTRSTIQSVLIQTTAERAFAALTRTGELREWFADLAWAEPHPGGRYALHWGQGYHVEGRFVEVGAPRRAVVAWHGTGEPGPTEVELVVEPRDQGVEVRVTHSGFGPGGEWDAALAQAEKGWQVGLENLKSTIEDGVDLRLARQPFLGIILDQLTPDRAEREGIAASWGIYVDSTVEGSGAAAAGLHHGDVIVALGGVQTPGFDELGLALRARQAGDVVSVELVRGQERQEVPVTLSARPRPELPGGAQELAERLAERHRELEIELRSTLGGLGEEIAGRGPGEGQWSVRQILAHLSDTERAFHMVLVNLAVNGWLDAGPVYPDQIPGRIDAILAVTPTLEGLLDRFLADEAETVALVRGLPAETAANGVRFQRIATQVLGGPEHTVGHVEQMRQAIQAARAE